jgi:flagellar biosynthesis/type III secretory pathway protein FliH
MMLSHNTRESYEYNRGYFEGYKEGYNKALEDYMIKQQEQLKTPVVIIKGDTK